MGGLDFIFDLFLAALRLPLRLCVKITRQIKAPGMADMPGESQEEPSVMVVAMLATIR